MKKGKQKYFAFNTQLFLAVVVFVILGGISIGCAIEHSIGLCIGFAIATLLPIFVFLISPLYFIFSEKEIKIVYTLGQKEIIEWKNIRDSTLFGSWIGDGFPHYSLAYPNNEKHLFFVRGEIPKTRKTKMLIKKYYRKNIV